MRPRIAAELELLKREYPLIEPKDVGQSTWFYIPNFPIPPGIWNTVEAGVCFEAKVDYPGSPPYSFYVKGGLRAKDNPNAKPNNYEEPAATPLDGAWGRLSWQIDAPWAPAEEIHLGSNLLHFVRSFRDRLKEGL